MMAKHGSGTPLRAPPLPLLYTTADVYASRPRQRGADRWAAHFFSEGSAARAQMEQIKQEKDTKQIIRSGASNDNR